MRKIHFEQGQGDLFAHERNQDELFGTEGKLRAAQADDHGSHPPGEVLQTITLNRRFSPDEMERIRFGFAPPDMDYKWFMYYRDGVLSMHRSWTGTCVYRVWFREQPDGSAKATELAVYLPVGEKAGKPRSAKAVRSEVFQLMQTHLINGVFEGWEDLF